MLFILTYKWFVVVIWKWVQKHTLKFSVSTFSKINTDKCSSHNLGPSVIFKGTKRLKSSMFKNPWYNLMSCVRCRSGRFGSLMVLIPCQAGSVLSWSFWRLFLTHMSDCCECSRLKPKPKTTACWFPTSTILFDQLCCFTLFLFLYWSSHLFNTFTLVRTTHQT